MGALTKANLSEHLFNIMGLNKREAKELVELFYEEIRSSLERGEVVKLSGFGNFNLICVIKIKGRGEILKLVKKYLSRLDVL